MHKIISLCIFISIHLYSSEPILAILNNIDSNTVQKFNIGNYNFYCNAYGILSLETIYSRSKKDSQCKKSIDVFYTKNPKFRYFSEYILDIRQRYHVEFKDGKCLLYAKGELSLSEILLKNGLAIIKPMFKDKEFEYRFKNAQLEANLERKGMWDSDIQKSCKSEISAR